MTTMPTRAPSPVRSGAPAAGSRAPRSLVHVLGALSGAVYVVLIVVGNGLYTEGVESLGFGLEMLGYAALVSFIAYVATALRGDRPWAATLALIGGVTVLAVKFSGWATVLAATRSDMATDTAAALILIDEHAFVLGWFPHGMFVIGLAAAAMVAGRLPRWLCWIGRVIGATEIVAVLVPAEEPFVIPFLLALLWIIGASITLAIRERHRDAAWTIEV